MKLDVAECKDDACGVDIMSALNLKEWASCPIPQDRVNQQQTI